MRGFNFAVAGITALCAVGIAHANVIGVSEISVTSGYAGTANGQIQVGELIATQAGTGTDVALASNGGSATAFSVFSPGVTTPSLAIDGDNSTTYPDLYHSAGSSSSEYLDVFLASATTLSSITIYGRSDCCSYRDLYDVSLLDANGKVLYSGVIDGTANGAVSYTLAVNNVTSVPEPASMALLGAGLFGVAMMRRRTAH